VTKLSRTGFDVNQTRRTRTYACAEKYPEELLERVIGTMLDGTRDPLSANADRGISTAPVRLRCRKSLVPGRLARTSLTR